MKNMFDGLEVNERYLIVERHSRVTVKSTFVDVESISDDGIVFVDMDDNMFSWEKNDILRVHTIFDDVEAPDNDHRKYSSLMYVVCKEDGTYIELYGSTGYISFGKLVTDASEEIEVDESDRPGCVDISIEDEDGDHAVGTFNVEEAKQVITMLQDFVDYAEKEFGKKSNDVIDSEEVRPEEDCVSETTESEKMVLDIESYDPKDILK